MKMAMIRVSNDNGRTWTEKWIKDGLFNVEAKRLKKKGYIARQSIVKKEVQNV